MAADLQLIVDQLKEKTQLLAARYTETCSQRDAALRRAEDLDYTVRQQEKTIQRLSQQVEYLTIVSTIIPSRDDIETSRSMLSDLVREIDKCITDLTE